MTKTEQAFFKWWNENWPDLAPTHQALHAWQASAREQTESLIRHKQFAEHVIRWAEQHPLDSQLQAVRKMAESIEHEAGGTPQEKP